MNDAPETPHAEFASDFERQQATLEDFVSRIHYSDPSDFRVATWNVEWAPQRKREAIRKRVDHYCGDVFVLTEGDADILPSSGTVIEGGSDWGYPVTDPARRKILMWAKDKVTDVDPVGSAELPPGRFVAGTLSTSRGPVRIIGVCIPWRDAHVRTAKRTGASPWSEHLAYLEALGPVLSASSAHLPVCVLGDFNQRIPSTWTPRVVRKALEDAFRGFTIITAGDPLPGLAERAVDHIAVSPGLTWQHVAGRDRLEDARDEQVPRALSDHHLISCSLKRDTAGA